VPDFTHDNLTVAGRHVPEPGSGPFQNAQEAQAAGYDTVAPVTGMYEIGIVVDGAFVPLISEKASLVFDRIALAKQNAQAEQGAQAQAQTQGQQAQSSAGQQGQSEQTQPQPQG